MKVESDHLNNQEAPDKETQHLRPTFNLRGWDHQDYIKCFLLFIYRTQQTMQKSIYK